ncbi:aldehyde dehydrogenase [Lacisediminimonas sp.]|uniref:aldehyde dehydrogenase family protein n=1 Tax=Lacisediminimonas sp. TaxID=3060582 RepID=UPI00271BC04D|nr:aldehyde dehydrogenase family protein [Lacisediminimonas sp.]MDO8300265.1 aldehyde dehydrogenase family protein [Lacisediminimonas sp.]
MIAVTSSERPLPAFVQQPLKMLIDGQWVDAVSGKTSPVENPATGKEFARVPAGAAADIDLAVQAARRAFEKGTWARMSAVQKERILWRLSDLFEQHIDELVELEIIDNGMPISLITRAIERAIDGFRYYAGMCTKLHGVTSEISGQRADFHAYTLVEPVGVVGLIVPWNSPFSAACNKIAPALAAGCSAVLKPAEQTPLTALFIGRLALEAGIPPGVLNVVTGNGQDAGAALANHPDVNKISFTGSTEVGKQLVHAAAGNLKRLTLELGGKSPVFVFDDADMDIAIPRAAAAIFSNSGQICYAGSRLYIQKNSFDKVVAGIADIAKKMRMGDSFDKKTELGPLISKRQHETVLGYIESGIAEGAELVTGGHAPQGDGYYVEPTVFANTGNAMRIVNEEIFGPVLCAMPFNDLKDVPALANATPYGLGAGIFTSNISTAHLAAKRINTGNVWVNFYGGADKSMPFGGTRQSGWGREGSIEGIEAFLEKKAVYIRL